MEKKITEKKFHLALTSGDWTEPVEYDTSIFFCFNFSQERFALYERYVAETLAAKKTYRELRESVKFLFSSSSLGQELEEKVLSIENELSDGAVYTYIFVRLVWSRVSLGISYFDETPTTYVEAGIELIARMSSYPYSSNPKRGCYTEIELEVPNFGVKWYPTIKPGAKLLKPTCWQNKMRNDSALCYDQGSVRQTGELWRVIS